MDEPKERDYIFFKSGSDRQKVILSDILYAEGMKNWCRIHTSASTITVKSTMKQLLEQLGGEFMQVHKSYIISIHRIEGVKARKARIAGNEIPVGRIYWADFLKTITNKI